MFMCLKPIVTKVGDEVKVDLIFSMQADPKPFTDIPDDLRRFIGGRGQDKLPFLHRENVSPRVPCTDFSPWLMKKIRSRDVDALKHFVYCFTHAIDSMSDVTLDQFKKERCYTIERAYAWTPDDNDFIVTKESLLELRTAFFIMMLIHKEYYQMIYFSRVAFPHLIVEGEDAGNIHELQRLLKPLSFGARNHVFDLFAHFVRDPSPRIIKDSTLFGTRFFGIDPRETSLELLNAGLIEREFTPESLTATYTKSELMARLKELTDQPKKSWTKEQLVEFCFSELSDQLPNIMGGIIVGTLSPIVTQAIKDLLRSTKIPFMYQSTHIPKDYLNKEAPAIEMICIR